MYEKVKWVSDELMNLCQSVESNQKNVTRITNVLGRIKITTVEQFKETSLSEIVERIRKHQRVGTETLTTLERMHG